MNNLSLGVFQFSSFGEALKEVHNKIGLLEVIPMGKNTTVIFESEKENLEKISAQTKVIINNPHPNLLKTYLSLENSNVLRSLLVAESSHCGELFEIVNKGLELNLKVVDFRIPRTEAALGYVILTSENSIAETKFSQFKQARIITIDQVGDELKSHYNLF
jgi:hypothetical protein